MATGGRIFPNASPEVEVSLVPAKIDFADAAAAGRHAARMLRRTSRSFSMIELMRDALDFSPGTAEQLAQQAAFGCCLTP